MENVSSTKGESLRELLVATHLYYDIGNKSLRARAFGEIITKILFLSKEKKARFDEIMNSVSKIVGVPKLTPQDMQSGLEFLREKGAIIKQGKFWFLKNDESKRIEVDLNGAQQRIDYILNKHFGTKIEKEKLASWFKETSIKVFSQFSEVWAKRLKREPVKLPDPEKIQSIISESLKNYGLESSANNLINGFNAFLQDYNDVAVEQQVWSFAQAMLSAKLVTASVGPDPLSISEFQNSRLLLDTNILFIAALEKSRLAKAFSSLAASIQGIGTSFAVTKETKEEYEKVVMRKRVEVLRVVENYSLSVIEDAQDVFLKTALARGCVDKDGFARFFDSIKFVPDKIGTEQIEVLDSSEIENAIQKGRNDTKKQAIIGAEWKSQRHFEKAKYSLEHDAALDSVLELLRAKNIKSWIITADQPMQTLSAKWAGSEPPTWIGIDTLIQILAISAGGPSHNPEHFASLFGTIIRDNIHSSDLTFTLEDLDALLDLEERVKELENDEIEKFAAKMKRLRMSGKSKNDSELQLEIRRIFQRKKMSGDENTRRLERRVEETEESLKKEEGYGVTAEAALAGEIYKIERLKKFALWLLKLVVVFFLGVALLRFGVKFWNANKEAIGSLLVGIGIAEFLIPVFLWIKPGYKKIWVEARELAEQKAKKMVDKK